MNVSLDMDTYMGSDSSRRSLEKAFVAKFSNKSISKEKLEDMSRSDNVDQLMMLPANKVWVVPMYTMTIETFYAMRFMCLSLEEFTDMVTFGSLNEIRQVFSTLSKRMDEHMDVAKHWLRDGEPDAFALRHPSQFMITESNPEFGTMELMYGLMKERIYRYMNTAVTKPVDLFDCKPSLNGGSELALMKSREFWINNVVTNGIKAKAWQSR